MSKKKKWKPKSLNPPRIYKTVKGGYKICWWTNCENHSEIYGLCLEHYKLYKKKLQEDNQEYGNDCKIKCLNPNLNNEILTSTGQWNHGNNK